MAANTPSVDQGLALGAESGVVTAATATATMTPAATRVAYLANMEVTAGGATAGSTVTLTVTGLAEGTRHYVIVVPTGAAVPVQFPPLQFTPGLPASAPGVAIVASMPTLGAGNTAAAVNIHGFQL